MKHVQISFCILPALMILNLSVLAQTSYSINSSANWSAKLPSTCFASGATLTVDQSATCQNCTFVGGNVAINNKTFTIQYAGSETTTYFNGTNVTVSGTAKVIVNAPLSISNADFTFNNTSTLTTSYDVALSASEIHLNDNTSMMSTGGSSTTIGLADGSRIVIGNGSQTSTAIFTVSGPTLTVYDKSSVAIANQNNVYYNWASSYYQHNANASSNSAKPYATSGVPMNCGGGYAHSCSNPSLYGPATLSSGVSSGAVLPVVLDGFTATLSSDHTVSLYWNTQIEINFSHFTIQRSADGANWNDIGTLTAKGNSATQIDYTYTDEQPLTGTTYYRLALVNLDNSYTYSEVKTVESAAIAKLSFFPNPARDFVNVSLGGASISQVTVLLSNISGQLMQEKTALAGNGSVVTFPIRNLAAGMYILSVVHADGSRESSPVLISRS